MLSTALNKKNISFTKNRLLQFLFISFVIVWIYRSMHCIDVLDWYLENALVLIFVFGFSFTYHKFQFSDISYIFIWCFLMLHIYGAQYAYTQEPFCEFLQNKYQLVRNPYDRIVHFSFGFLLAYPLRDLLFNHLNVKGRWQFILPVEIILSLACIFELIEWAVAELASRKTGETYVATQGDVWDAHKDIVLAVLGAAITMCIVYFLKKFKK